MNTEASTLRHAELAALPSSYFRTVDAKDLEGIVSHFAQEPTLIVETDQATFSGATEIRGMFRDFLANSVSVRHEITNVVVDETAGRVATEQNYISELADGTKNNMHNCNFFDISPDGKFTRVIIWMAGTNPLK